MRDRQHTPVFMSLLGYWMKPWGLALSVGGCRLVSRQSTRAATDTIAGFVLTISGGRGPP
eukprot:9518441-Alexandrium_andersonii.AAC.1